MTPEQQMVAVFHQTFGLLIQPRPAPLDDATRALRLRLIQEEFD